MDVICRGRAKDFPRQHLRRKPMIPADPIVVGQDLGIVDLGNTVEIVVSGVVSCLTDLLDKSLTGQVMITEGDERPKGRNADKRVDERVGIHPNGWSLFLSVLFLRLFLRICTAEEKILGNSLRSDELSTTKMIAEVVLLSC